MRVKCLAQEHNTMPQARAASGVLTLELSVLTIYAHEATTFSFTITKQNFPLSMHLLSFGVTLRAFYHECLSLIGYTTYYHCINHSL